MAHGGYGARRAEERRPLGRRSKGLGVDRAKKKQKPASLKNQIRSIDRLLRKNLPSEMREAQEQKLEELKRQQEVQTRLAVERKIHLRNRKIKFIERRKIERSIRRLEKQQRLSSDHALEKNISSQLSSLKEDLEYVKFFPKTEKYVSLLVGGDSLKIIERRNKLRKQIKANLLAAAASGKDLEETASDDDALDMSDDDFFVSGSSDEAEADDEWTDKSTRCVIDPLMGKKVGADVRQESKLQVLPAKQHQECLVMKRIRGRYLLELSCLHLDHSHQADSVLQRRLALLYQVIHLVAEWPLPPEIRDQRPVRPHQAMHHMAESARPPEIGDPGRVIITVI